MQVNNKLSGIIIVGALFLLISCSNEVSPNKEMIDLLSDIEKSGYNPKNAFNAEAKLNYYDSLLKAAKDKNGSDTLENLVALTLLEVGDEEKAVETGRRFDSKDTGLRDRKEKGCDENSRPCLFKTG